MSVWCSRVHVCVCENFCLWSSLVRASELLVVAVVVWGERRQASRISRCRYYRDIIVVAGVTVVGVVVTVASGSPTRMINL